MSYAQRISVPVTVDASGAATAYSPVLNGKLSAVHYAKTDFADGVDFAITLEATGEGIWTESNVNAAASRYPRIPTHDQVGAPLLYATSGTAVRDKMAIANDRVKIVIAQGGVSKSGAFIIVLE